MNGISLGEQLRMSFAALFRDVVAAIPRVLVALTLVFIALVFASAIEKALRAVLVRLRFDSIIRRAGIDQWLQRVGIRQPINDFLPRVAYFLLLFLLARTVADALGLEGVSGAISETLAYLPNVIAALLILIVGGAIARFIGNAVTHAAQNAGVDFAQSLGNFVCGLIVFVLVVMALGQLEIETLFLREFATAVLAGIALAFGLSFGLGSRDATRNIIAGFYARRTFRVGEELEIGGERGILVAITPTQILLQQEGRTVAVANSMLFDGVVRQ